MIPTGIADTGEKYDVILCDPPWHYANRKTGGERKIKTRFGGGAQKHYPLMKDSELLEMADFIKNIAAKDSLLFMWATNPRLDFATDLVKAWGFSYSTVWMTWIKTTKNAGFIFPSLCNGLIWGPGGYTASNSEVVLLGRKGKASSLNPTKRMAGSIFFSPRQDRHSQKPDHVHLLIDEIYPNAKKIELFARRPYPGWSVWGNEIEGGRPHDPTHHAVHPGPDRDTEKD